MDNKPPLDNLERAQLLVLNRKHQFIMQLAMTGRSTAEIKSVLALIDYDKEIEWAVMCYNHCDWMAELQAAGQAQGQAASGS